MGQEVSRACLPPMQGICIDQAFQNVCAKGAEGDSEKGGEGGDGDHAFVLPQGACCDKKALLICHRPGREQELRRARAARRFGERGCALHDATDMA